MGLPSDKTPLSPQQAAFCEAYHEFNVGHKAYLKAYPSSKKWESASVDTAASHLLSLNKVKTRIAELKTKVLAKTQLSIAGQVKKLDRITEFDPAQLVDADGFPIPVQKLPENVRKAIQELKVKEYYNKDGDRLYVEHKYKIPSRVAAIDQENKHIGFYELDNAQKTAQVIVYQQFMALFGAATQLLIQEAWRAQYGELPGQVDHGGDTDTTKDKGPVSAW